MLAVERVFQLEDRACLALPPAPIAVVWRVDLEPAVAFEILLIAHTQTAPFSVAALILASRMRPATEFDVSRIQVGPGARLGSFGVANQNVRPMLSPVAHIPSVLPVVPALTLFRPRPVPITCGSNAVFLASIIVCALSVFLSCIFT